MYAYAAPIWITNTSPSLIQKLQTIQNSALRIATGCVKMTSIGHLHEETKMLPVQVISYQYHTRTLQPNNPSDNVVTYPSDIRNMKQILHSRILHCVTLYISTGILLPTVCGTVINSFHTKAVSDSKFLLSHNRLVRLLLHK